MSPSDCPASRSSASSHLSSVVSNHLAALLHEFPNGGVAVFDEALRHEIVGGASLASVGLSADEIVGKTISEVFDAETAAPLERAGRAALRGERCVCEVPLRERVFEVHAAPLHDADGAIVAAIVLSLDITERKRAQAALQASETKFRAVFEQAPDSIVLVDGHTGDILEFNDRAAETLGYTRDEFSQLRIEDIEASESPAEVAAHIQRVLQTGGETFQTRQRTKDGRLLDVLVSTRVLPDSGERQQVYMCIWTDITAQTRADEESRRSELLLRETQQLAMLGGWEWDVVSQRATWTDAVYKIYDVGKDFDTSNLERIASFVAEGDRERLLADFERCIKHAVPFDIEVQFRDAAGREKWCRSLARPVVIDGRVAKVYGYIMDITASKTAAAALAESEQKFRRMFEQSADAHVIFTAGEFVDCNQACLDLLGRSARSELIGHHPAEISPERQADGRQSFEKADEMIGRAIADGSHRFDWTCVRKNGELLQLDVQLHAISYQGRPAVHAVWRDMTARRRAEMALHEALQRNDEIERAANVGFWDWGLATDTVVYSDQWKRQIGYEPHEISNSLEEWRSRVHPDDLAPTTASVQWCIKECRQDHTIEFRFRHRDGSYRWIMTQAAILQDENGRPIRMRGSHVDITARRQAEEALHERERYFRLLLESLHEEILVIGPDYRVQDANGAFISASGTSREAIVGRHCYELTHGYNAPCDAEGEKCPLHDVFAKGVPKSCLHHHAHVQGEREWVDILMSPLKDADGNVVSVIEAARDVTEVRRAEERRSELERQLRESQKMEAVGQLAGGIAHDFNNLLTTIYGHVELLEDMLNGQSDAHKSLRQVREAAEQAAAVARALLTFSHRLPTQKCLVDVRQSVDKSLRLLRRLIPSMIEVRADVMSKAPLHAVIDETQFQQVIMNLVVNARDAMPDGGRIDIAVTHTQMPPAALQRDQQSPHGYVVLTIADTGCGIDPEIRERIFEPFFTTKPRGAGTGLGLAIVHGVVNDLGGAIHVESRPGAGSTFTVAFPAAAATPDVTAPAAPPSAPTGDDRLVLIAEDDPHVRNVVATYLRRLNYEVVQVGDGEELVRQQGAQRGRTAVLVVDYEMPKLDGLGALAALRAEGDTTPAVLVTAHVGKAIEQELDPHTRLCRKPFQLADLARIIAAQAEQHPASS